MLSLTSGAFKGPCKFKNYKMRHFFNITTFTLLLCALAACNSESTNDSNSLKPVARGEIAEVILVMDSAQWKGPLGREIRRVFSMPMPGLPQEEPLFELKQVAPRYLNSVLRSARNMIFVTTLDNNTRSGREMKGFYTPESLERIQSDSSLFYFTRKDNYARGQEILYLFGKDTSTLIGHLRENAEMLRRHFESVEKSRMENDLFKVEEKKLAKTLEESHNFSIRIPYGYEMVKNLDQFVWLRSLDTEIDKSIIVYYEPYTSQEVFSDIPSLRSKVTEKYLRDIEKDHIFITYQKEMPFIIEQVNFKGNFAIETRGLWKTSDSTNGGPFISYTFVDRNLNRLYYIEGYVYAPSKDKRDLVRELKVILQSFKASSDGPASDAAR